MSDLASGKPSNFFNKLTQSSWALIGGVLFCLGYTVFIYYLKPFLPQIEFAPDTGFAHYYWKLPDPTFWSRATAWGGYFLHQISIWALIYYSQTSNLAYVKGLHPINIIAMLANAFFVLLHLFQTQVWYDGLAQDVHILSSQGSVILLLVMVLIMENQRRGIAFGQKSKFLLEPGRLMRKYHGYVFSWAIIYTFWYHPMETTVGHLVGTFYTCMIMLQGSLMFTRAHINKYWTFLMEFSVVVHGTIVALMQGNGMWGQFMFGFLAIFIITQMHGLGISKWLRWCFIVCYVLGVTASYSILPDHSMFAEVPRIPATEYGLAFILGGIFWLVTWLVSRVSGIEKSKIS